MSKNLTQVEEISRSEIETYSRKILRTKFESSFVDRVVDDFRDLGISVA